MGIFLRWDITNNCKMNCIHCYNAEFRNKHKDILKEGDIRIIIERLPIERIKVVKLMGGEPFDSEYIDVICATLEKRGLKFGLTTNGDFDYEYCESIAFNKSMCEYITFSMDGYQSEARLFRRNLNVANVISNIKKIRENHPEIRLCLNLIINNMNYNKIYDILKFYADLGIEKVNISNLSGKQDIVDFYKCNDEQIVSVTKEISRFLDDYDSMAVECGYCCNNVRNQIVGAINQRLSFDYHCMAGRKIGYIDYMGNLLPCEAVLKNETLYSTYVNSGKYSLLKYDFDEIWMKEAFHEVYRHDIMFRYYNESNNPKCIGCNKKDICGDCFYITKAV